MTKNETAAIVMKAAKSIQRRYSWMPLDEIYQESYLIYLSCCQGKPDNYVMRTIYCRWIDKMRREHVSVRYKRSKNKVRMFSLEGFREAHGEYIDMLACQDDNECQALTYIVKAYRESLQREKEQRKPLIQDVVEYGKDCATCCKKYNIGRTAFYRWIREFRERTANIMERMSRGDE